MNGRQRKHVTTACDACRRRKIKCDGVTPCSNCTIRGTHCLSTAGPDRRKTLTKPQYDALIFRISALENENTRLRSLVDAPGQHAHPISNVDLNGHTFHAPGSSSSHTPASGSPASFASSLSGSMDDSLFLAVPNPAIFSRGPSPAQAFASQPGYGSDTESNLADEFSRLWVSPGKHFVTHAVNEDLIAIAGSSPIALACTSPRSPSPLLLDTQTLNSSTTVMPHDFTLSTLASTSEMPGVSDEVDSAYSIAHVHGPLCPCDWSRHIPAHIRVDLTQEDHDSALVQYFRGTAHHTMVMPDDFLRDMRRTLASFPPEAHGLHYSPALHCAILADVGAFVQVPSVLARDDVREALARTARDLAEEECTRNINVIPAIRALCIIARYYIGLPNGASRAFGAFGTALRVALLSGLTLEPVASCSAEYRRVRAWCIASVMSQDVSISLHLGQELSVPLDLIPGIAERTMAMFKDDPELASFAHMTALAAIAARIAALYSRDRPRSAQALTSLQTALADWQAKLPSSLAMSRGNAEHASIRTLMLNMAYNRVLILLHRLFCAGAHTLEESQKIVQTASKQIFKDLATLERLHGLGCSSFTLIQVISVAGAAQLMRGETLSAGAAKARAEVNGYVSQARDALQTIARTWPCAAEFARALDERIPRPEAEAIPASPIVSPQPVTAVPFGTGPILTFTPYGFDGEMWSQASEFGGNAAPWGFHGTEGQI